MYNKKEVSKDIITTEIVLSHVTFPEENRIKFWQDFRGQEGLPSDKKFYPKEEVNTDIIFIADGYGITKNNCYGLSGEYGNGAVYVACKDLPVDIVEWCRKKFLIKE